MTDSIEQEIQAKASTAPRVTPGDIEAEISAEFYFTANDAVNSAAKNQGGDFSGPLVIRRDDTYAEGPLSLLTFCVLLLKNGFTVTGESACASPENFNANIGRSVARENAKEKIWPLLGFRLRDRLSDPVRQTIGVANVAPHTQRVLDERTELKDRHSKLSAFILDNPIFLNLPEAEQARLQKQEQLQAQLLGVLDERIAAFGLE